MIVFDTKHDYIYYISDLSCFFLFFFLYQLPFTMSKNLPKGIVITSGKVVRLVGGQLMFVGNIRVC